MKIVKNIFSIILSFALVIAIIATTLTTYINRMLQKDYILEKFDEIDIYSQVLMEIQDYFENYIYQSGMGKEVIENICTKEKVKSDIKTAIYALYSQRTVEIDTKEIEEKLDQEINTFIGRENRKISKEEEKNIKNFKSAIVKAYKSGIEYYQITTESTQKELAKVLNTLEKAKSISKNATIALIIILLIINVKSIFNGINYISISLLSSGIVLLLINWLINSKFQIDNFMISINSLTNAFTTIIRACLDSIVSVGMWTVLFGIIGILLVSIKKI
ncbi:MAG: hypothetical protein OSJ66_03320 [Clostridia bacterium]|nr:hypothetical protein [Clostridia bacterium]